MRVVIESPYSGDVERNVAYARRCIRDCLLRGEYPIASHLLYTQEGILDDTVPAERKLGMEAGWSWINVASRVIVFNDYGITDGMSAGIKYARDVGATVEYRLIGKNDNGN